MGSSGMKLLIISHVKLEHKSIENTFNKLKEKKDMLINKSYDTIEELNSELLNDYSIKIVISKKNIDCLCDLFILIEENNQDSLFLNSDIKNTKNCIIKVKLPDLEELVNEKIHEIFNFTKKHIFLNLKDKNKNRIKKKLNFYLKEDLFNIGELEYLKKIEYTIKTINLEILIEDTEEFTILHKILLKNKKYNFLLLLVDDKPYLTFNYKPYKMISNYNLLIDIKYYKNIKLYKILEEFKRTSSSDEFLNLICKIFIFDFNFKTLKKLKSIKFNTEESILILKLNHVFKETEYFNFIKGLKISSNKNHELYKKLIFL